MNKFLIIGFLFLLGACAPQSKVDLVLVQKSTNKMYFFKNSEVIRTYEVAFGPNPVGHKIQEGDGKTPEGRYMLTYKNPTSKFYKSIRISYPNQQDIYNAQYMGVKPGGDIVLHGMPNEIGDYRGPIRPRNWTLGCVAVRNFEMDEIWALIEPNTPIEIVP